MEYRRKYGGVFLVRLGPLISYIVFSTPKSVEYILGNTKNLEKTGDHRFLYSWLGTGLLTATKTKWKKHRRVITPAFHFKVLEDFVEVFNSTGNVLVEQLRKEVGKKSFDIVPFFSLFTLDAICGNFAKRNLYFSVTFHTFQRLLWESILMLKDIPRPNT